MLKSSSWLILCYRDNLLQSISYVHFGQDHLFAIGHAQHCWWRHVQYLPFSCSFISFFTLFSSSTVSTPEVVSVAAESCPHYDFLMCYHYNVPSLGFLFSGFWDSCFLLWYLMKVHAVLLAA